MQYTFLPMVSHYSTNLQVQQEYIPLAMFYLLSEDVQPLQLLQPSLSLQYQSQLLVIQPLLIAAMLLILPPLLAEAEQPVSFQQQLV